jgi:hypothetical protein
MAEFGARRGLRSSETILEQFAPWKTVFFPRVVSCDEIALWKILLLGEIQD